MLRRLAVLAGFTALVGARPLPERALVAPSSQTDLDSFTDEHLHRDLMAELNVILKDHDANEDVSAQELFDEVMAAVDDNGDDADPDAAEITLADLEEEMEEAHTCVEDVVRWIVGLAKQGCEQGAGVDVASGAAARGPAVRAGRETELGWVPPRKDIPSRGAREFQRLVRAAPSK